MAGVLPRSAGKRGSLKGGSLWMRGGARAIRTRPVWTHTGWRRSGLDQRWRGLALYALAEKCKRHGGFDELGNVASIPTGFDSPQNDNLPGRRETTPLSSVAGSGRQAES